MDKSAKTIIEISFLILLIFAVLISFVFAEISENNEKEMFNNKENIINFSSLDLVNRTLNSNIYYNKTGEYYVMKLHSTPINYYNGSSLESRPGPFPENSTAAPEPLPR